VRHVPRRQTLITETETETETGAVVSCAGLAYFRAMRTFALAVVTIVAAAHTAPATAAAPAAVAPAVVKRTVVTLGRKSGTCVTTTAADGTITVALDVLENGRGPRVNAKLALAPDGTIAALDATGRHTFGTKVAETFHRDGRHARWKSEEEHGERDVDGAAFFLPMADIPETLGLLVRAALHAGGKLALLPGGEARVERVADATVRAGAESRRLVAYAVTGLDLTPTYAWMNEDGTWFGYVSAWFSVVPDGWQSVIESLVAKQTELTRARDATLAATAAHKPPAAGLAYTHARVLDVEAGRWLADQTVVVVGDTIRAVAPNAKPPAGAEVVDLHGKALLPGLWDLHAHLGDADGVLNIASGVTTVRDVGNEPDRLDDYKRRYESGAAVGPRVFRFGFIEGRGPKAAGSKVTAETEAEAKAAVAEYARRGYDGIKIYNSMRPELVPVLAKEAHARGMAVTGHIPVHMLAHEAVRAGYDGIEHINMLFLNFFATHDTDTRDTTRFTLVGDKAAAFDLASAPVNELIALLKDHHTVVDPTVSAFEDLLCGQPGKILPGLEATVARLPVQVQRGFLQGGLPLGDKAALYRASYDKLLTMVKRLIDAKITVVTGTDGMAGLALHHELALFVRGGVSTADALRAATVVPARALGQAARVGTIAPGKTADLVVVDGDPLAHIDDIAHVVSTMRGGVVFASAPLYESVGVRAR
jgi:Amidohydrolase family